jgi:hypothetical protein
MHQTAAVIVDSQDGVPETVFPERLCAHAVERSAESRGRFPKSASRRMGNFCGIAFTSLAAMI